MEVDDFLAGKDDEPAPAPHAPIAPPEHFARYAVSAAGTAPATRPRPRGNIVEAHRRPIPPQTLPPAGQAGPSRAVAEDVVMTDELPEQPAPPPPHFEGSGLEEVRRA